MEDPIETGNVGDISVDVPETKLEETRRIVEQEIAEAKAKGRNLLENFEQILPNNFLRNYTETSHMMDKTPEQYGRRTSEQLSLHSPIRIKQTNRQFYGIVDKAIAAEGFSIDEIRSEQVIHKDYWDNIPQDIIRKKMLPVYVRLRAMGYTFADLQ